MKKNILIVILVIIAAFSILYAIIKRDEARKASETVKIAQAEAEAERERADVQAQIALDNAVEARRAIAEAERAIQECQ